MKLRTWQGLIVEDQPLQASNLIETLFQELGGYLFEVTNVNQINNFDTIEQGYSDDKKLQEFRNNPALKPLPKLVPIIEELKKKYGHTFITHGDHQELIFERVNRGVDTYDRLKCGERWPILIEARNISTAESIINEYRKKPLDVVFLDIQLTEGIKPEDDIVRKKVRMSLNDLNTAFSDDLNVFCQTGGIAILGILLETLQNISDFPLTIIYTNSTNKVQTFGALEYAFPERFKLVDKTRLDAMKNNFQDYLREFLDIRRLQEFRNGYVDILKLKTAFKIVADVLQNGNGSQESYDQAVRDAFIMPLSSNTREAQWIIPTLFPYETSYFLRVHVSEKDNILRTMDRILKTYGDHLDKARSLRKWFDSKHTIKVTHADTYTKPNVTEPLTPQDVIDTFNNYPSWAQDDRNLIDLAQVIVANSSDITNKATNLISNFLTNPTASPFSNLSRSKFDLRLTVDDILRFIGDTFNTLNIPLEREVDAIFSSIQSFSGFEFENIYLLKEGSPFLLYRTYFPLTLLTGMVTELAETIESKVKNGSSRFYFGSYYSEKREQLLLTIRAENAISIPSVNIKGSLLTGGNFSDSAQQIQGWFDLLMGSDGILRNILHKIPSDNLDSKLIFYAIIIDMGKVEE